MLIFPSQLAYNESRTYLFGFISSLARNGKEWESKCKTLEGKTASNSEFKMYLDWLDQFLI